MIEGTAMAVIDELPALVVSSHGWRDEYADAIQSNGLKALSIRVPGDDLTFLNELGDLEGLVLNAAGLVVESASLESLERLGRLRTLTLNVQSKKRLALNFAAFPHLRRFAGYWNRGFDSLFMSPGLEELYVFGPPDVDLERFGALASLRRLELSTGRKLKSTRGIDRLAELEFVGLYLQSALAELAGIESVATLREVAIEGCKRLTSVDRLAGLTGLRRLKLANCGEIDSLKPLVGLSQLEEFYAWESTRIVDGDLSVLAGLPNLRTVAMASRRDYRPSVAELESLLARRARRDSLDVG